MRDTIHLNAPGMRMIAHRGLSGLERENTCAAFVAAGNRSYYGVETDVHRTADGRFIIIHDDDTRRVAGEALSVEGSSFDALRALRLTDLEGNPRADLVLPSLEEYVRVCRHYGKVCVLEIKNHMEKDDIEKIVGIISAEGWLKETIFISFDLPNMIAVRELLPDQRAQYLTAEFADGLLDVLTAHRLDLDIHHKALTPQRVKACHDAGVLVNTWTVDTIEDARRAINCGVDWITSNILE